MAKAPVKMAFAPALKASKPAFFKFATFSFFKIFERFTFFAPHEPAVLQNESTAWQNGLRVRKPGSGMISKLFRERTRLARRFSLRFKKLVFAAAP